MSDYDFPESPEIEKAYRTAHRALEAIAPDGATYVREADMKHVTEVLAQFPYMVREAEMAAAIHVGPRIAWEGPWRERDWELIMAGVDLDCGDHDFGADLAETLRDNWEDTPLRRAASAYRRECGWDFAPGEAGVWLLMLAPVSAGGGADKPTCFYGGHLAGFMILHDRDNNGAYESIGHVWTARRWRRQGIARRLLREAGSRFGTQGFEGPFTEDGAAFVKECGEAAPAQ